MSGITDTNGVAVTHVSLSVASESESQVVVVRVPCVAGMYLAAGESAAAQVLGRLRGGGAAFVDLRDAPILLTPWAGATVEFEKRKQEEAERKHREYLESIRAAAPPATATPKPSPPPARLSLAHPSSAPAGCTATTRPRRPALPARR